VTATGTSRMHAVGGSDVAGGGGAGGASPQRRTFVNPTTEGDKRHLFGQGRPMAKDSSGSGANWYQGSVSAAQNANQNQVESRLFFEGTVTTGLDRATDARERQRIGIFGTGSSYAGSYGRVTSESIGRDLNPLGRGDGMAYLAGALNLGRIAPRVPRGLASPGTGNSVNNQEGGRIAGGSEPTGPDVMPNMEKPCDDECCPCCIPGGAAPCESSPPLHDHFKEIKNPCWGMYFPGGGGDCRVCLLDWEAVYPWCIVLGLKRSTSDCYFDTPEQEGANRGSGGGTGCGSGGCGGTGGTLDTGFGPTSTPGGNVNTGTDPRLRTILARLDQCVCDSGKYMAACICDVIRHGLFSLTGMPWSGLTIPGWTVPPIIWISMSHYKEGSECDLWHTILHEAAHQCGQTSPEWRNFLPKVLGVSFSSGLWSPIVSWRPYIYSEIYGPDVNAADAIAEDLMSGCCCDGQRQYGNPWIMHPRFLPGG